MGTNKKTGDKITVRSKTDKFVPVYKLTVETQTKDGKKEVQELKREFREWFDEKGAFVPKPFQRMMAGSVPVIGRADPKNAAPVKKETPKIQDNRTMDEKWASLLAESEGALDGAAESTSTPTPAKGKRRGKKA